MKKLLLLLFMLAIVKIEAQQNRGIEKTDIRRGQTQRSIENDTLKNANPNKSAKLIVPVAIDKGLRQGITTPKQTQGATFGEKVNQGLHAAGSALSNGAVVDTLKRADKSKAINNINGGMPNRGAAVVDTLKRTEKTKKHTVETNDSSKRMDNGAVVDTLKRAHLKKLADELVNINATERTSLSKADAGNALNATEKKRPGRTKYSNITLKTSSSQEIIPKEKSTISETGKVILVDIKENLDSKENRSIETGVINSGETVDIKKNKIDVIKGTANPSNERRNGVIKNIFPPGSGHFTGITEIDNFTWQLIGADIPNAVYVITITKIGNDLQPSQIFTATTPNSEISAKKVAKFKAGKALADELVNLRINDDSNEEQAGDGQYKWKITETTTGISSNYSFFTIREGGRTVEAGQVPEKNASNGSDDMGDEQNDTKRAADLKKLADELVNAFAIDDVIWSSNINHNIEMPPRDIDKPFLMKEETAVSKRSRDKSTNPIVEEENQRAKGDLKNIFPPGNKKGTGSRFKNLSEIAYFAWEIIGADIPNAEYVVEITKIGKDGQPQQTFIGKSTQRNGRNPQTGKEIKIAAKKVAKFKAGKALADTVKRTGNPNQGNDDDLDSDGLADTVKTTDGQQQTAGEGFYIWKVTETTTGISSAPSFFTVSDSETTEDCLGYQENSAMLMVKIDETSLRNTNTVINDTEDTLTKKRDERMGVRALRAKDAREGYRAKQTDARMKDARMKNARMKDARMKDARTQNIAYKPIETSTVENNKKVTQIDINTKYLRVQNNKTVEISKSYLQLIAPILPCKNNSKTINYYWTVKGTGLNIEDSFNGNSVKYNFTSNGTYEINITPTLNGINLNSFHIIIICK